MQYLPLPSTNRMGWPWTEETNPIIYQKYKIWPKISIVTPSYNQGKFIEETIRSVLLQNYPNIEYIVIDGGSTDDTVEIIKKYERWITYWVSEPDSGQTQAINKGFHIITGEITNWLNSDDYLYPKAAYEIGDFFRNHRDVHFMHGSGFYINEEDGKMWSARKNFDYPEARQITHFCYDLQPSCYFRKEVFDKIGYLNEGIHLQMDTEFFIRIALNFNIKRNPVNICYFRKHQERKSIAGYKQSEFVDFPNEYHKIYGAVLNSLPFSEKSVSMLEAVNLLYKSHERLPIGKSFSNRILEESIIIFLLNEADSYYTFKKLPSMTKEILYELSSKYSTWDLIKFRVFRSLWLKNLLFR